jgi:Mg2+ and Co2+ transporter CorA
VTGIFGMNVAVPGEGDIHAFWAIFGIIGALGLVMLGFFRWKKWL